MRLTGLQPLARAAGPVASVCLDVSRTTENADHELRLRWRSVAATLSADGAPGRLIDNLAERLLEPLPYGGELQRYAVVSAEECLIDTVAPLQSAQRDYGHFGPMSHVMPLIRLRARTSPYVLVKVDHVGADLVCADATGLDARLWRSEGDHDVLHKVPGGGWSHRRYQSRVEDSWDRNADQVVEDLDKIVADHRGEPVFLVGDPYARSVVRTHATGRIADQLIDLGHGSRAAGSSDESIERSIVDELAARRASARDNALSSYRARRSRAEGVAAGLSEVIAALREGSLETLLMVDQPDSSERLSVGPVPTLLGHDADELTALGVSGGFEDRADEVILRALIDVDGELHLLDDPPDELPDGVGGLLRFDTARSA
jgi:Bacterial archaeo-eukaryotic release factor family 2